LTNFVHDLKTINEDEDPVSLPNFTRPFTDARYSADVNQLNSRATINRPVRLVFSPVHMGRRARARHRPSPRSAVLKAVAQVEADVQELEKTFHRLFGAKCRDHPCRSASCSHSGSRSGSSLSASKGPEHEWHVRCDVLHALVSDAFEDYRERIFLFYEEQGSPLAVYAELCDVLYRGTGKCLLRAFDCADFDALKAQEAHFMGQARLVRALSHGSEKVPWSGLSLATIRNHEFHEAASEIGRLLKKDLNALLHEIHAILIYNHYPAEIALSAARKLKKWEELLLGTESTRWLDFFEGEVYLE
jgi:hypothetical protein